MLNNKQFSTTLQLNAFPSESESLSFLDIIIFNSHPRADHRAFTGVWWVVFTGAPQQGVRALAPAVLDTVRHSCIWLLPALLPSEVLSSVKMHTLLQNMSDKLACCHTGDLFLRADKGGWLLLKLTNPPRFSVEGATQ